MSPELITLIINIALGVFIILGFLFGLKGIKKATFNLITLIINLVLVLIVSPLISKLLLNVKISGKSINEHISGPIIDALGEELAGTSFIHGLIQSLPVMLINVVTSIALILIFGLILKIIGAIIYRIIYKKDKETEVERCEIVNGAPQMVKVKQKKDKHRLAGGAVGAIHGFILALALFLPTLGLLNVYNDIVNPTGVYAETVDENIKNSAETFKELIPSEVHSYTNAVSNSLLYKIGDFTNLSELSFNLTTLSNINGQTILLGNEIKTMAKAYDYVIEFANSGSGNLETKNFDTIFNNIINNPEAKYDYNMLHSAVNTLFNSKLIIALHDDALKFAGDALLANTENEKNTELLKSAKNALYAYAETKHLLSEDIEAFVNTFKICAEEGIIKTINEKSDSFNVQDIKSLLLNEEDEDAGIEKNVVLNKLSKEITSSYLLQTFIFEFSNYGIGELEKTMNDQFVEEGQNALQLKRISSTSEFTIKADELSNMVVVGFDVYDTIKNLNTQKIGEDFFNIFDEEIKIEDTLNVIGRSLDAIVNVSMIKGSGVYDSICDAMALTEYNKYLDFSALKTNNAFSNQFEQISQTVKEIRNAGIISQIREMNDENYDEKLNQVIDCLSDTQEGKQTNAEKILTPMLKCSIFKNTLEFALSKVNEYLENQLVALNQDAKLSQFNTSNLMTETENANLINVVNKLLKYISGIDASKLSENEFIETLIYSDLVSLGDAFDSVKNSTLFADYDGHQGVYNDIMDALSNSTFNNFFDFACAKDEEFTWKTATKSIEEIREEFDSVIIQTANGCEKLLKYILTSENYNLLLDNLQGTNINFTNVFELDLIKPIAVEIINLVNEHIKNFVNDGNESGIGDLINANIGLEVDVASQANSINKIINTTLQLDLNSGINIETVDKDKLNNLLNELEENAMNNGVFKEAYNALLIKTTNLISQNIKEMVGVQAGSKIDYIKSTIDLLASSSEIKEVLNAVLDTAKTFKNLEVKTIKVDELFNFIDVFNKELNEFQNIYNSLLVYTVNTINQAVVDAVGAEFSEGIEFYSDNTIMINDYAEIKSTLTNSQKTFKSIGSATHLEDLDVTLTNELMEALGGCKYTQNAKEAVSAYLASKLPQE